MRQDVETALFIMDKIGDQITGCKGILEDLPGIKAPVARQGQVCSFKCREIGWDFDQQQGACQRGVFLADGVQIPGL